SMVSAAALASATSAIHRFRHALRRNDLRGRSHRRHRCCTRVLLLDPPGQQDHFSTAQLRNPLTAHTCASVPLSVMFFKQNCAPIATETAADERIAKHGSSVIVIEDNL